MTEMIPLSLIDRPMETQSRTTINLALVDEYTECMLAGAEFPPIDIFKVKERFVVADGHHRLIAAVNAKIDKIPCVIHEGGLRDAVLFSVGANAEHGRRRSPGDMRRVVEKLLTDKVWSQWNDTAIAARCHVSHSYVSKIRNQSSFHGGKMTAERKVTRKGITYEMKTTEIGRRKTAQKPAAEQAIIPTTNPTGSNVPIPEVATVSD